MFSLASIRALGSGAGPASSIALRAASRRAYTNTSVYTRADNLSSEEHLKVLLEEQKYLMELLKADDSQAPWCRGNVDVVSREVQEGFAEPKTWKPHEVFH